jgi:DNA repair exonuclease SbcCD ATPase subunit
MRFAPLLLIALLGFTGCSSAYYGAMEKVGVHKREILVDRVESAREAQNVAKEQFADALEQFLAVSKVPVTELQATYKRLNDEFKRSESRAQVVRDRIAAIDDVAQALFREWDSELGQYSSAALRSQSERQLRSTRERYTALMRVMEQASARMTPVLNAFRDQVLYLKHNLNAQAIAALDGTTRELQQDISRLIADMDKSIREADIFISAMKAAPVATP